MAESDDYRWWWSLARTLDWRFAKTMPKWPHWYAVAGKTANFGRADLDRLYDLIRHDGRPAKFFSKTRLELLSPDGEHKVWCQLELPVSTYVPILVNLARTNRTYGEQSDFDAEFLAEFALPEGRLG